MVNEKGKMKTEIRIEKFKGDFKSRDEAIEAGVKPYEVIEIEKNCLLNEGINELWTHLCSAGGTKFDNGNAYIGVGDSSDAAVATQTGLQAVTNKLYKAMDETYPTYGSDQKAVWRATFGTADANWAWNEITVANGGSDASKNLNRKVQTMGTKASGTTWTAELTITLE
ncbi:MAG: hypothetical protein HWN68_19375 [Desulfobacterales bacterium]|nr:hypothetical protein [Desulfobacterales bacterium]